MVNIQELVPDARLLVALAPEQLAETLLKLAASQMQNGMFQRDTVISVTTGTGIMATRVIPYPQHIERLSSHCMNPGNGSSSTS